MYLICSNVWRTTNEEKRALERLENDIYNEVRKAAEVHRRVRSYCLLFPPSQFRVIFIAHKLNNLMLMFIQSNSCRIWGY
jgi:methionyl aminopeptidase